MVSDLFSNISKNVPVSREFNAILLHDFYLSCFCYPIPFVVQNCIDSPTKCISLLEFFGCILFLYFFHRNRIMILI